MAEGTKTRPEPTRPLPSVKELDTGPFWEATKQHELRFQQCADTCGISVAGNLSFQGREVH